MGAYRSPRTVGPMMAPGRWRPNTSGPIDMSSSDESSDDEDDNIGIVTRRVWDGSLQLTPEEWADRRPPTAGDWLGAFPLKLVAADVKAQPFVGVLMARLTRAGGFIEPLNDATFWVDRERLLSEIVAGVITNYDKWLAMPPGPLALMLAPTRERYFPQKYRSRLHGSVIKLAP